jgi:hypothetical protein
MHHERPSNTLPAPSGGNNHVFDNAKGLAPSRKIGADVYGVTTNNVAADFCYCKVTHGRNGIKDCLDVLGRRIRVGGTIEVSVEFKHLADILNGCSANFYSVDFAFSPK